MKLIQDKLDPQKTKPVWFDPWQHQFDKSPVVSLLHTVVNIFEMGEEAKIVNSDCGGFGVRGTQGDGQP